MSSPKLFWSEIFTEAISLISSNNEQWGSGWVLIDGVLSPKILIHLDYNRAMLDILAHPNRRLPSLSQIISINFSPFQLYIEITLHTYPLHPIGDSLKLV